MFCVEEPQLYGRQAGGAGEAAGSATEMIDGVVLQHTLPLLLQLFGDEDPMPLYALKIAGLLLERNPHWMTPLAKAGVATR